MNAVLVLQFGSWHPNPINHKPEQAWYREGTFRILFTKNDKFSKEDYDKLADNAKAMSMLEGKITEITLDAVGFVSSSMSTPVNRHASTKLEFQINKTNYSNTAADLYKKKINELLQYLRVSYTINKVLLIEQ